MLVGARPQGLLWPAFPGDAAARPAKVDKFQPATALKKGPPPALAKIQALPPRSVLFAFDWDGTLATDVSKTAAALQKMGQAPFVMINTGRTLADLQAALAQVAMLPRLDALACSNGTLVFENSAGLAPAAWLSGLTLADADPTWTQQLSEQSGWKQGEVLAALSDYVEPLGKAVSRAWPDGAELNAKGAAGLAIAEGFIAKLAEQGISAHYEVEHWGSYDTYKFAPAGIAKSASVAFQASRLELKAVLTAGDGPNDASVLETKKFVDANGMSLSNQPIVCGQQLSTVQMNSPILADSMGGLAAALPAALAKQKIAS